MSAGRWAGILAAVVVLASCQSDQDRWRARRNALASAVPVINFELGPRFAALRGDERSKRESEVQRAVEDRCAKPIFGPLAEAAEAATAALRQDPIGTLTTFLSPARSVDHALVACFLKEGASGSVFLDVGGTELSSEQYVVALIELARSYPQALILSGNPFGGCGSRGGPGWRKGNGQCASWRD